MTNSSTKQEVGIPARLSVHVLILNWFLSIPLTLPNVLLVNLSYYLLWGEVSENHVVGGCVFICLITCALFSRLHKLSEVMTGMGAGQGEHSVSPCGSFVASSFHRGRDDQSSVRLKKRHLAGLISGSSTLNNELSGHILFLWDSISSSIQPMSSVWFIINSKSIITWSSQYFSTTLIMGAKSIEFILGDEHNQCCMLFYSKYFLIIWICIHSSLTPALMCVVIIAHDWSVISSVHLCPGVIRALYDYYQTECRDCVHVWLSAETDHYCSSAGDKGWGCGYRNFQMLLSSLHRIDAYSSLLQGARSHCIISDLKSALPCPHTLCFIHLKEWCEMETV